MTGAAPHARKPTPDQAQRDAAVAERGRNVLIDAGAGTGKTTILVDRLVNMVAPRNGNGAIPITRVAAITFTRKAAGELRLRIRERLLEQLATEPPDATRARQLRHALAGLDTACVGTIHSFADRLLRLCPVEAELSPSYDIVEDEKPLVWETFEVLLQAVESGTLAEELAGSEAAGRADEVTRTILDALAAGVQAESRETEWYVYYGLDALVEGFIRQRDVPPPDVPAPPFGFAAFRTAADEFLGEAALVHGGSPGAEWIVQTEKVVRGLREYTDPIAIYRELKRQLGRAPRNPTKRDTFAGENEAWRVWKLYAGADKQRPRALRDDLTAPLDRWMATRLMRLFPVAVTLYERVKARRRQLDQLDLLAKLRDLLVKDRRVRGDFQQMFDHIFVDEFQDTDPLQAEIVLLLCEPEPRAPRWDDVALAGGKLTLVGDPKQSIYRFRRADVAMYDRVRDIVACGTHLEVTLSANFRSVPPLIEWFNNRFAQILGISPDDRPFDPATGQVFQQPLAPGRAGESSSPVQVLAFDFADGGNHKVDEYRELEGRVLARHLRWLVEASGIRVVDELDGRSRPVRYGDIAVLVVSTWRLSLLFPCLDAEGIAYASRGGTLFLQDPLHQQFLLGLRAVADRDDGVAEAALLRPPFFGIDLLDLLTERTARRSGAGPDGESASRVREARELISELRRTRFDRAPGATARDLLERTAFARAVALGPNGTQRLARLRELCLVLEQLAADQGLDYDAATARLREWVERPVRLDPPNPIGQEAVQVMTVHQAKGLEFPVVAIWDGKSRWDMRPESGAWRMERDGRGWMLDLHGLTWEEPPGFGIRETERAYLEAERRRVIYVAATRARDLLIVPKAGNVQPKRFVCGDLLAEAPSHLVNEIAPYVDGSEPARVAKRVEETQAEPAEGAQVDRETSEWWTAISAEAARPRFQPVSVSRESTVPHDETLAFLEPPRKQREGRFGSLFGTTVHQALGLILRSRGLDVGEAARRAARRTGLEQRLDDVIADLTRTLGALRAEGLVRPIGPDLQVEYPVAAAWEDGKLLSGYIDLVGATNGRLYVIDLKTDAPPQGMPVDQAYPEYTAQVHAYGRLLAMAGILGDRELRCGLLFTADGGIRWVETKAMCVP